MAAGYQNVLKWTVKRLEAEVKKALNAFRNELCDNANKVYAKLKANGASVPKRSTWDSYSCDQKIGFIAALGPYGSAMLAAGALVGGWVSNTTGEWKKFNAYGYGAAAKGTGWLEAAAGTVGDAAGDAWEATGGQLLGVSGSSLQGISLGRNASNGGSMRGTMDVDFGFLGKAPGRRGSFGGLGYGAYAAHGAAMTPAASAPASGPGFWSSLLNAGTTVATAAVTKPAKGSSSAPVGTVTFVQQPGSLPSWALPVGGLLAAGAIGYFLFLKK